MHWRGFGSYDGLVFDGVDFDDLVLLGLFKAWQLGDNFWYPLVIQFCLEIF